MSKTTNAYLSVWGWITALGIITSLMLPRFVHEGVFIDGLTYASVSRNLAMGLGSLWKPYYADAGSYWLPTTTTEVYYDAPPLVYLFESQLFKLLGDHWYVEKLYSFGIMLTIIGLMAWHWQAVTHEKHYTWLAVVLIGLSSQFRWALPNNLLDNTMAVFCLLSIGLGYKAMQKQSVFLLIMAGLCVFLSFLCKGPVGLFSLALPMAYWLIFRDLSFKKSVFFSLILIVTTISALGLLMLYEPAQHFMRGYFEHQLVSSLSGKRIENVEMIEAYGRWLIVMAWWQNIWPMLVLAIGAWILLTGITKRAFRFDETTNKTACFWLLLALAGSLPIALSPRQAAHYLIPSLPFWSLTVAVWVTPILKELYRRLSISPVGIKVVTFILFLGFVAVTTVVYRSGRMATLADEMALIERVKAIGRVVPKGEKVAVATQSIVLQAHLNNYLQRYCQISLTTQQKGIKFALTFNGPTEAFTKKLFSEGFILIPTHTEPIYLLKR